MQPDAERHRLFRRRALVLGGVQVGLFGLLTARLWQLQVEQGEGYALLAEDNRVNRRVLMPPRGRILDRQGRLLATNEPTYRLLLVPEQARDIAAVLAKVRAIVDLPEERIARLRQEARGRARFIPLILREDLRWDEVARLAVHAPDLPGVDVEAGLVRRYPEGRTTAHLLGYVGPVNEAELARDDDALLRLPEFRIGKSGIEAQYERSLRGSAGVARLEVNAFGRAIREVDRLPGRPGSDLSLSLDLELQRYCTARIAGEASAACVVIDVRTGGILAMASVPSFDPHAFADGLRPAVWAALRDDPLHPLVDKAIRGEYPPGSTFKMMTAIAALQSGVITPTTRIHCSGSVALGRAVFHCWRKEGHGALNVVEAIEQSCDCFFYEAGRRAGIDAISEVAHAFGLGEPTGIDLPGERPGAIPSVQWKREKLNQPWHKGETLIAAIGQGYVLTTPVQLAVMTARLASGGRRIRPWLVRPPGLEPDQDPPLAIDPRWVALAHEGMSRVVNGGRGTARKAALRTEGAHMAGKTGTSQVRRITAAERASGAYKDKRRIPWRHRDHALFVGFAPVESPRYAVAVIVEHGVAGSQAAAPVARDVLDRALQQERGSGPFAGPVAGEDPA